jgi:hypothetical protein
MSLADIAEADAEGKGKGKGKDKGTDREGGAPAEDEGGDDSSSPASKKPRTEL